MINSIITAQSTNSDSETVFVININFDANIDIKPFYSHPCSILGFVFSFVKMLQIKMFAICLAAAFVLDFVNCADNELNVQLTTVQNITRFLRANPKFKFIQNLIQTKNPQDKNQITYRLGNRISGKIKFSLAKYKIARN